MKLSPIARARLEKSAASLGWTLVWGKSSAGVFANKKLLAVCREHEIESFLDGATTMANFITMKRNKIL